MHEVIFYRDKNGKEPVLEYIRGLAGRTDKDSRIKAGKINDYIEYLARHGKAAGEPYVKYLDGKI